MLIGPDLHQFKLVCESLKHTAERRLKEEEEEDEELVPEDDRFRGDRLNDSLPLLRAWLGLLTPGASVLADDFRGSGHEGRLQLIVAAESALDLKAGFSDFQRKEMLRVTAHVTNWGLMAGAGKRQMLLACAHMAHARSCKSLIWIRGAD